MGVPKAGASVRGSTTGRPIMVILDLLGRRAALRILWELHGKQLTFRALQDACETNPGLLNARLHELRDSGLVEHSEGGYQLTALGKDLQATLQDLNGWAKRWAEQTSPAKSRGVRAATRSAASERTQSTPKRAPHAAPPLKQRSRAL